jgi:hypothetical protein
MVLFAQFRDVWFTVVAQHRSNQRFVTLPQLKIGQL